MTTQIRFDAIRLLDVAASFTDRDAAVVDFDSTGVGYARLSASGATAGTSRGVKIRSLNAGTPFDAITVFANGDVQIGPDAGAAGSTNPLEVCGTSDGVGIALSTSHTGAANAVEVYITSFIPASDGLKYKVGSMAFTWASKDTTTGYGAWNVHVSDFSATGVQRDNIELCVWARQGGAFFGNDSSAAGAPGPNILKVFGDVVITSTLTAQGATQFSDDVTLTKASGAAGTVNSTVRNTTATGRARLLLGNDATAAGGGIYLHGSTHATNPSEVWIGNEINAATVFFANGVEGFRLRANLYLQYDNPLIAMGGGSAATLGTIGGSGPSTATQNSWKQEYDDAGSAYWIPVWK